MSASYSGHESVVSLLIEKGTDVSLENKVKIEPSLSYFICSSENQPLTLQERDRSLAVFVS